MNFGFGGEAGQAGQVIRLSCQQSIPFVGRNPCVLGVGEARQENVLIFGMVVFEGWLLINSSFLSRFRTAWWF